MHLLNPSRRACDGTRFSIEHCLPRRDDMDACSLGNEFILRP